MGRREFDPWERIGEEFYSPVKGWGCPESEASVKLVAEKCYSFREYNRNLYFRRESGEWRRALPQDLTAMERGHFYKVRAAGEESEPCVRVSSVRVADEETVPLLRDLRAWVNVPRYGVQTAVQAMDREFRLAFEDLDEFEGRVRDVGGEVRRCFLDLARIAEEERAALAAAGEHAAVWEELGRLAACASSPSDLEEIERLVARAWELAVKVNEKWLWAAQALREIRLEPGRLADKAQVEAAANRVRKASEEVAGRDLAGLVDRAVKRVAELEAARGPGVAVPSSNGWRKEAEVAFRVLASALEEALAVSAALASAGGDGLAGRAVAALKGLEGAVAGADAAVGAARDTLSVLREQARKLLVD